jgi:hypothetical protein
MDRKHGVKSIQIDLPKATVVDVPGKQVSAVPTCRRAQKKTGTRNVTITDFKEDPAIFHELGIMGLHFRR